MNNNIEIILLEPQVGRLDIDPNTEFPLNFSIGDIRDVTKKTGTFSKTIELAGTKKNNLLLNNYFDVNIQAGTFDLNKLQKCQVLRNGVVILDNAYIQLLSVSKSQNIGNNEELVSYSVVINDSISTFFNEINNKELSDLEFGDLDHVYTAENIIPKLSNTYTDKYKYFFQYNDSQSEYDLTQMKPAIYAKSYMDRIFESAGFTYQWDTFSADTVQFQNLLIPYTGEKLRTQQNEISEIQVIVGKSADTTFSSYSALTDYDITIQDTQNRFVESTGKYGNNQYINGSNTLVFELNIEFEIQLKNNETSTVTMVSNGGYINGGQIYSPNVNLFRDELSGPNTYPVYQFPLLNTVENLMSFGLDYELAPNELISFGTFQKNIQIGTNNSLPNDRFNLEFGYGPNSLTWFNQLISNQPAFWRIGTLPTDPLANVTPFLIIKNLILTIKPNLEFVGYNSFMRMNSVVPQKIKQSEFIKSILTMYNLFVEKDEEVENNLILRHRDEFYDSGQVKDWSKKLAKEQKQELIFLPDLSSKKLILTYKQDDSDLFLNGYKDITQEIYGQIEYTFDNEYVRNTETKELIFSPLAVMRDLNGNVLPLINNVEPKTNVKITMNSIDYTIPIPFRIINFESTVTDGGSFTANTVPLISHFNSVDNPSFDINFGLNDYFPYDIVNPTNNNLFNLYWRRTMNQINNGKMFVGYFYLNENDINELKLNDIIFVNNSYFYINKIIDFKANKNELTKVELLSVEDELTFSTPILNNTVTATNTDSLVGFVRSFVDSSNNSSNVIVSQSPSIVKGKNNLINGENLFVIGNNNQVTGQNSFVISNSFTGTTRNEMVVDNFRINENGLFNDLPAKSLTLWKLGDGINSTVLNNDSGNVANGENSIATGTKNTANGDYSLADGVETITNGENSRTFGIQTIANGFNSKAEGMFAISENYNEQSFGAKIKSTSSQITQKGLFILTNITTGSTPTELFLDGDSGNEKFIISENSVFSLDGNIVAMSDSGEISTWQIKSAIKNISGTTSIVGTNTVTLLAQDSSLSATTFSLVANDIDDAIYLRVIGIPSTVINWSAAIDYNAIKLI